MRLPFMPFGVHIKWKFFVIFLFTTLTILLLHLGWTKWLRQFKDEMQRLEIFA